MDGYKRISTKDLADGMEVIVESMHWDNLGRKIASDFYRAIVGHHRTVAGDMFHLVSEPVLDWPQIPPWQLGWIYAGNDGHIQMWVKEDGIFGEAT